MESASVPAPEPGRSTSFQVFAEWLKENRRVLEGRLDAFERKLEEIHKETRRTNGRVTDLEKQAELTAAIAGEHEQLEHKLQTAEQRDEEHRRHRRERLTDRLTSVSLVLLGLVGGGVLQHLGL